MPSVVWFLLRLLFAGIVSLFSFLFLWVTFSCNRIRWKTSYFSVISFFGAEVLPGFKILVSSLTWEFRDFFRGWFLLNDFADIFKGGSLEFFDSFIKISCIKAYRLKSWWSWSGAVLFWIFRGVASENVLYLIAF